MNIDLHRVNLRDGADASYFRITDGSGETLESVGIISGVPEFCDPSFTYVARKLEFRGGEARGMVITSASTIYEAKLLSHGLAKVLAEERTRGELHGPLDMTRNSGKSNPYQDEVEAVCVRLGLRG